MKNHYKIYIGCQYSKAFYALNVTLCTKYYRFNHNVNKCKYKNTLKWIFCHENHADNELKNEKHQFSKCHYANENHGDMQC